jgi:hypothetical protein
MSAPCPGPRADDEPVGTECAHTVPDDELPQHGGPMGDAVIAGNPHLLRASPFPQHSRGSLDRWRNSQITLSGDPPMPRARILVALLVVRT